MFLVQELFLAVSKVATRLDDADGFQGDNFLWLHISGIRKREKLYDTALTGPVLDLKLASSSPHLQYSIFRVLFL